MPEDSLREAEEIEFFEDFKLLEKAYFALEDQKEAFQEKILQALRKIGAKHLTFTVDFVVKSHGRRFVDLKYTCFENGASGAIFVDGKEDLTFEDLAKDIVKSCEMSIYYKNEFEKERK